MDGGGLGFEWAWHRVLISQASLHISPPKPCSPASTQVATALCRPLTSCTDPMSGFFCTTKEVLARGRDRINPIGFKIALEVYVRCRCKSTQDVPITFREREVPSPPGPHLSRCLHPPCPTLREPHCPGTDGE